MWLRGIFIVLAIWLVISLVKSLRTHSRLSRPATPIASMVRCEHCGLFLPEGEAILSQDHFYCCVEHKSLAER